MLVFAGFQHATRALRVRFAQRSASWVLEMICDIRGVFGCDLGLFARILRTEGEVAPVSIDNRGIFREIRSDFGAEDASIDHKTCATTAGIRRACSGEDLQQNFECAVRCA